MSAEPEVAPNQRSDIRSIRSIIKAGAYGNKRALAVWIYGYRPDGRVVACRSRTLPDGRHQVYSDYTGRDGTRMTAVTDFSAKEWARLQGLTEVEQQALSNKILDRREANRAKIAR